MRLSRELLESDLYALLGVPEAADCHEIRASYRRLARGSHPDIHPDDPSAVRRMTRLNVAARILLDPAERRAYDHGRRARAAKASRNGSWYDQVSIDSTEWSSPEPRHGESPAAGQSNAFRQRPGRTALLVQDAFFAMSNERRIRLAALCLALGWGLISFAHPSNAFWLAPAGAQASAP
jgi:DnaJ-class molecular chaperone